MMLIRNLSGRCGPEKPVVRYGVPIGPWFGHKNVRSAGTGVKEGTL